MIYREGLLTRMELARIMAISSRTLDRYRAAGDILDPLPGPGQPRWHPGEVASWIVAGRPRAAVWAKLRSRR